MKKGFFRAIKEINTTLNDMFLFTSFLVTVNVFLLFNLLFHLLMIPRLYAALPAAICFAYLIVRKVKENKISEVEQKYPRIKEKLRTAAEYAGKSNEVVDALKKEVIRDLRRVQVSSFLDVNTASISVFVAIVLAFGNVVVAGHVLMDLPGAINNAAHTVPKKVNEFFSSAEDSLIVVSGRGTRGLLKAKSKAGSDGDEDIFGEKSVAQLGDKKIEFQLHPKTFEVNVRKTDELEEDFVDELFVMGSGSFEDSSFKYTKEQRELVKKYFKRLAKS